MTKITRTAEETVARIKVLTAPGRDLFGTERSRLLETLPWEDAQQFMREGQKDHTAESWSKTRTTTLDGVRTLIREYLPLAWQKANKSEGMSAERSICHFAGLLWLLGPEHDEVRERLTGTDMDGAATKGADDDTCEDYRTLHAFFGKPALVAVSEIVSFNWRAEDNDEWRENLDMDAKTASEALRR